MFAITSNVHVYANYLSWLVSVHGSISCDETSPDPLYFRQDPLPADHRQNSNTTNNKSAQSNLGRGPRRGAVAHVRRKVPIGYNGAPQIRPWSTPSRGPIPKPHHLPHPWTRPTCDAKGHPDPMCRFSTMHWTDRQTDGRTDRLTDRSFTGKFDYYRPLSSEGDEA